MTRNLFDDLIANAVSEVTNRQADYFKQCELELPNIDSLHAGWATDRVRADYSSDELTSVASNGVQLLNKHGVTVRYGSERIDAISDLLISSIIDADLATKGGLTLKPGEPDSLFLAEAPSGHYPLRQSANGSRYILGEGTGPTLLIISATGVPLAPWFGLLGDQSLGMRFLIVQSRGSPLFEGGTPGESRLEADVADIQDVLMTENIEDIHVVAWCNGARVGVELCRRLRDRVRSVTFVAPTFYGSVDSQKYPSPFEQTLGMLCKAATADPRRHGFIWNAMLNSFNADLAKLKGQPLQRADAVLRQPPQAHLQKILRPFASIEYLKNYVARATADAKYDARSALLEISCPMLLLTGTHDAVCNTLAPRDLLRETARVFCHVTLMGAGHHIQLLQGNYLLHLLRSFTAGVTPTATARMRVECHGSVPQQSAGVTATG